VDEEGESNTLIDDGDSPDVYAQNKGEGEEDEGRQNSESSDDSELN